MIIIIIIMNHAWWGLDLMCHDFSLMEPWAPPSCHGMPQAPSSWTPTAGSKGSKGSKGPGSFPKRCWSLLNHVWKDNECMYIYNYIHNYTYIMYMIWYHFLLDILWFTYNILHILTNYFIILTQKVYQRNVKGGRSSRQARERPQLVTAEAWGFATLRWYQ